jgi:hypothetical protein
VGIYTCMFSWEFLAGPWERAEEHEVLRLRILFARRRESSAQDDNFFALPGSLQHGEASAAVESGIAAENGAGDDGELFPVRIFR